MKKITKRIIALLCAVVLIAGMIPTGILPAKAQTSQEDGLKKVLTSCDSKDAASNIADTVTVGGTEYTCSGTLTTDSKYVSEGTGSFGVSRNAAGTMARIYLNQAVDVKGYKYLSLQLYISNADALTNKNGKALNIELHTQYYTDVEDDSLIFRVSKEELKTGWNDLKLPFAQAIQLNKGGDTAYDGQIKYVLLSLMDAPSTNIQFYIDDLCVQNENEGVLIADCDQKAFTTSLTTIGDGNGDVFTGTDSIDIKEGTGAWKSNAHLSGSTYRLQTAITLADENKLDLSDYVDSGYLHLWLYVGNVTYLTQQFEVELTSAKATGNQEANWSIATDALKPGWNEIKLPLSSAGSQGDDIRWEAVNYFRIVATGVATADTYTQQYMILDDIRVADYEVLAEKLSDGTVTPALATAPTKEGYVFGGYYNAYDATTEKFSSPLTEERDATSNNPVYIKWVTEEVMTVKAQVRQDDTDPCKKVLHSCDTKNVVTENDVTYTTYGTVSTSEKEEGTGSLGLTRATTGANQFAYIYLDEAVDVNGYETFSCKIYVDSVANLTVSNNEVLRINLYTDYAATATGQLSFSVMSSQLDSGWNTLILSFANPKSVGTSYNGKVKLVTFQTMGVPSASTQFYFDDICVRNENEGLLIADCDTKATNKLISKFGASRNTVVTEADGIEIKEGTGAIKDPAFWRDSSSTYAQQFNMTLTDTNKLDLSDYKTSGYLHFWLYIADVDCITNDFEVFLSSADGNTGASAVKWNVAKNTLKEGEWNEINLPLGSQNTVGSNFAWAAVNFFMIRNTNAATEDTYTAQYMILDDIRIIEAKHLIEILPEKVVTNCDTANELSGNLLGTDVTDIAEEGSGAFVRTYTGTTDELATMKVQHMLQFKTPIDFSQYKNGCLRFWYYIDDPSYLGATTLVLEISDSKASSGDDKWDTRDKEYLIKRSSLKAGWNEIYVYLGDATHDSDIGSMDWSNIQHMRLYSGNGFTHECMTMIDDISLVDGNAEKVDIRFISTVESLGYQSVGFKITQSRSSTPLYVDNIKDVYQTLWALGRNGVPDDVTPFDISGAECSEYMYAATVQGIPNRLWDATFTVRPYWITQDGTKVWGANKTYIMNYARPGGTEYMWLNDVTGLESDNYNQDLYGKNLVNDIAGNDPGVLYDDGYYYMYLSEWRRSIDGITGITEEQSEGLSAVQVTVRRSKDLYNWETCGALEGHSLLVYEDDWIDTASAIWAPEVIKNPSDGKYYMYFTAIAKVGWTSDISSTGTNDTSTDDYKDRMFLGVAVADSPTGPFVTVNDIDEATGRKIPTMHFQKHYDTDEFIRALDPNPFFDGEDFYLYFVRHADETYPYNRICGIKMTDMTTPDYTTFSYLAQPNYKTVNFVQGKPSWELVENLDWADKLTITFGKADTLFAKNCEAYSIEGVESVSINEGPSMVKYNGKYYITYSEDQYRSKNYSVHVAVSDDPLLGFEKLSPEEGGQVCYGALTGNMYGTGHHSIVHNTDADEWWIVYHRHATDGIYNTETGLMDTTQTNPARYISVDRLNWVTYSLEYKTPVANGPFTGLNWLSESASGYANLVKDADISASGTGDIAYLKDGVLPFYTSTAHKKYVSENGDLKIVMKWDKPVTVSSVMVYNAYDPNAAFSKISNMKLKLAETSDGITKACDYAIIKEVHLSSDYWNAETGAYVNCAPIVAEFDEMTITELTMTIRAEDHLISQNESGVENTSFDISEIVVLGRNK